ncbi:unnamed protein product [Cuscuta europaea]|uniref:Uncharacterized protein n=1 Tax=Cuscuta europaea TaxID=41803 RepID=A0A9P1ECI4_CUSEU|nr:unnamed protein product [Cuscuta europaea]
MAAATTSSPLNLLDFNRKPIFPCKLSSPRCRPTLLMPPGGVSSNSIAGTGRTLSNPPSYMSTCLVIPPPPKFQKPKAIIKFIGGAFIGAVPEVTYSYLLEMLAVEGYLIICVPYNVTFDHAEITRRVSERFTSCLDSILCSGLPDLGLSALEVSDLPLYSVGHSNGALLQTLTESYFSERIPKANVIISYNNRPASEAVPYFKQLGLVVSQMLPVLATFPVYSVVEAASGNAWKLLLDTAETVVPNYDQKAFGSFMTRFTDQLPLIINELAEGISEFKPTPLENLKSIRELYNVQSTLLVKFDSDTIDETDQLEETLRPRIETFGGKLEKAVLSGNHITPCLQELRWEVGNVYTPADALGQVLKNVSVNDTRRLATTIANWLDRLSH